MGRGGGTVGREYRGSAQHVVNQEPQWFRGVRPGRGCGAEAGQYETPITQARHVHVVGHRPEPGGADRREDAGEGARCEAR